MIQDYFGGSFYGIRENKEPPSLGYDSIKPHTDKKKAEWNFKNIDRIGRVHYGICDEDEPTHEEKQAQLRLALNRTVARNYDLIKQQKLEISKTATEFRLNKAKEKREFRKNKFIQDRISKVDRRKAHVLERFQEYCGEMDL